MGKGSKGDAPDDDKDPGDEDEDDDDEGEDEEEEEEQCRAAKKRKSISSSVPSTSVCLHLLITSCFFAHLEQPAAIL